MGRLRAVALPVLPVLLALLCGVPPAGGANAAELAVRDDSGRVVRLERPARRIVSLSPHATELLFAAGAGARVVGVSRYSDFPPQARSLPRIGDSERLDLEALLALQPDLVVAWGSALSGRNQAALQRLGLPVFRSEPRTLELIASNVERLADLAGSAAQGRPAAQALRARVEALRRAHAGLPALAVFVQVWSAPLMTVNRDQVISDALAACGARNLFADQTLLVPTVDPEAVVAADPAAIIAGVDSGDAGGAAGPFARWLALPQLRAVAAHHLLALPSDLLGRPGPRFIDAAEKLCAGLDQVRAGRPLAEPGPAMRP